MNILFELLSELKYQTKKSFTFDISSDEDKTPIVVTPFVSVEYPCQTYLVIETENQALCKVNNDYLKALALAFRKADFHESDAYQLQLSQHKQNCAIFRYKCNTQRFGYTRMWATITGHQF